MSHLIESHCEQDPANGTIESGESSGNPASSSDEASQVEPLLVGRSGSVVNFGAQAFALAALGFVGMFGYAWWKTKEIELAWPYMNGQRVFTSPASVFLGEVPKGTSAGSRIRIVNLGSESKSILGAQKSCPCITITDFPIEIPARGTHEIDFLLTVPNEETAFSHSVTFFTDEFGVATMSVNITGVSR